MPIKNEKHEVVLFLASHKDVSKSDPDNLSDDEDQEESTESPGPGDLSANPYQRRRSRAVLYQLSGHYRRRDTVKSKLKLNNVSLATRRQSSARLFHYISYARTPRLRREREKSCVVIRRRSRMTASACETCSSIWLGNSC